jgi:hypothetical protein
LSDNSLETQAISACSQLLVNKCFPRIQHLIENIYIPKLLLKLDFFSFPDKTESARFFWNGIEK